MTSAPLTPLYPGPTAIKHMLTLRALSAGLVSLLVSVAACSQNRPETAPSAEDDRTRAARTRADSVRRRNTVIENSRPDMATRTGMLVVANQQGASATVLDAGTLKPIVTLPVGAGPHEVAVSPDGRWAVVTNYGTREVEGNSLSVIDLAAQMPAVVRTIDLGSYRRPHGAAFVQSGVKLLVTSETSQRLLVVDFATGKVDTALATNGRGSHMVAVQRDGRRAWTANMQDGTVTEYDVDTRTTKRTYPVAAGDEAIAASPGGIEVWVGSNTAKTVTVIDGAKATPITTLTGFSMPYRVAISRSGRTAVVSDPVANQLRMFDLATKKELAVIDLASAPGVAKPATGTSAGPEGITFDPISDIAYVTLHGTNQVAALDVRQKKIVGVGSVGAGPDGIGFSPLERQ